MGFSLPTFNLQCGIWRAGNPVTNPPDATSLCNLCRGERGAIALTKTGSVAPDQGGMWLLLPAYTDVRDNKAFAGPDTVEVPLGSGRYYLVIWTDWAGMGFSNQHVFAEIIAVGPWPVPFPPTPSPPPGPIPTLLGFVFWNYGQPPVALPVTYPSGYNLAVILTVNDIGMPPSLIGIWTGISPFIQLTTGVGGAWTMYLSAFWVGSTGVSEFFGPQDVNNYGCAAFVQAMSQSNYDLSNGSVSNPGASPYPLSLVGTPSSLPAMLTNVLAQRGTWGAVTWDAGYTDLAFGLVLQFIDGLGQFNALAAANLSWASGGVPSVNPSVAVPTSLQVMEILSEVNT